MSKHVAIDEHGKRMNLTEAEVKAKVLRAFDDGTLIMAVVRAPDDNLYVNVFGPPSLALADMLDGFAKSYRAAVKGILE